MSPEPVPNPKDFEGHAPMISRTTERAATAPSSPSIQASQFATGERMMQDLDQKAGRGLTPDERGGRTIPDGGWFPGVEFVPDPVQPEQPDMVNHPAHYSGHPSGIECIEIVRHMGFNLGNAFKYIWRADLKGSSIQDLKKAVWYINDEIEKRERAEGA
jgi:hypothetical protein